MRVLSETQARRCESATHPRCRCRCRGQAHGRNRIGFQDRLAFEQLSEGDPHKLPKRREDGRQT